MYKKNAKWVFVVLALSLLGPANISAQDIIYVDTSFSIFVPETVFGSIDLGQCTDNLIEEELSLEFAYDIMVMPSGETFGYGVRNAWLDTVFFRNLSPFTINSYLDAITINHKIRGLTCDENGKAYAAGLGITQCNSECCDWEETYLGDLPAGMQCQGDITYRKGKFYIAAVGNRLVEVDMKNLSNSQFVMDFPIGTLPIHGLATVQVDCDSVATYAIGRAQEHSEVYEIDFDNWTISLVCDMPELAIDGAGSLTECMLPPCAVFVDLDDDNSSFGFLGNHCVDTFCISPVGVSDTDAVILSGPGYLDSITFELVDIIDLGSETLVAGATANIAVTGNSSTCLTLVDNGATLNDFEDALKSVEYLNNALMPSPGKRKVIVRGWADGEASPLSIAELPLFNAEIQFHADLTEPSCHGFADGSITVNATGGVLPYEYQWAGGATGQTIDDLTVGVYPFTITDDLGCGTSSTLALDEPDTLLTAIENTGLQTICDMSGVLVSNPTGGSYPYTYSWDNGSVDSINADIGPGFYQLTVTDANGCEAFSLADINSGDTVLIMQEETICEGEVFQWQGGSYSVDTLACLTFVMPNGCDSTTCLGLQVDPVPEVQLSTDGNLCDDDEVTIDAGQHSSYFWSTGETTSGILVNTAGTYSVSVTNPFACGTEASILISPGLDFTWSSTDPKCADDGDGVIGVDDIAGGTPPFSYSIDGVNFSDEGIFENLPPGTYQLGVLDATGCFQAVEITLESAPEILLDAGDDQEIELGESASLTAVTNLPNPIVDWQPAANLDMADELSVTANPTGTTLYIVEVLDSNGCSAQDELLITVDVESDVYVPTAFSPNGDGTNDEFQIYTDGTIELIESLQIFDRWGNLVFERKDIPPNTDEGKWDGNFDGQPAQTGAYALVAKVLRKDGVMEDISGAVSLIR